MFRCCVRIIFLYVGYTQKQRTIQQTRLTTTQKQISVNLPTTDNTTRISRPTRRPYTSAPVPVSVSSPTCTHLSFFSPLPSHLYRRPPSFLMTSSSVNVVNAYTTNYEPFAIFISLNKPFLSIPDSDKLPNIPFNSYSLK